MAYLPSVTIRVIDPPEQPSMLLGDGTDLPGPEADGPLHDFAWLLDDQEETRAGAPDGLRAEVSIWRGFVLDPERGSIGM